MILDMKFRNKAK